LGRDDAEQGREDQSEEHGTTRDVKVLCRIDTAIEVDYYQHGGILPFVLRELVGAAA